MRFSPQQEAVFAAILNTMENLIILAVAGAGKTTVLKEICSIFTRGRIAFLAYNKKIADEIKLKVAHLNHVQAGTFHSFGFKAMVAFSHRAKMESNKMRTLAETISEDTRDFALAAVGLAKQAAFGIITPIESRDAWYDLATHYELFNKLPENAGADVIERAITDAITLLKSSNAILRTSFDFDDMLYGPLYLNLPLPTFALVMVDEAQDTNPARRLFAKRMIAPGGRFVAVGDPHQAIYGFTGADNNSLDLIRDEFNCTVMPLTVTYRCPKAVVAHAQAWVNHITAADEAPEGLVRTIGFDAFNAESFVPNQDAILCRNTKPLVQMAFSLIRRGIGAKVEGRDIAEGLAKLAKRWKTNSLATFQTRLNDYQARETQKLMSTGKELVAEQLTDKIDTLRVIIDSLPQNSTVRDLVDKIYSLFEPDDNGKPRNVVLLSTVHKSKGREWQRVFLLGRNLYMPSKWARQAWQQEQERNLIYVAVTRAKAELVEVDMPVPA